MNGTVFFVINDIELEVEQVLVEFNEAPIFFVCKNANEYYIASCLDLEKERYLLARVDLANLAKMLHGKLSMREFLLQATEFWDVIVAEDVSKDVIIKINREEICLDELPYENAYLTIATPDMERYVDKIDSLLYSDGIWEKANIGIWAVSGESYLKKETETYSIMQQQIFESAIGNVSAKCNNIGDAYEDEVSKEKVTIGVKSEKLQVSAKSANTLSWAA